MLASGFDESPWGVCMSKFGLSIVAGVLGAVALAGNAVARPIVPAEKRVIPYTANLPDCDNADVLERLSSRFAEKEAAFWHSDLHAISYDRVGAYGWRANGRDYIPRRYCAARVLMSNDRQYWATYTISEDLGIIGFGFGLAAYRFGLEWCVAGLDRNGAHGSGCMAVRPVVERLRRGALSAYRSRPVSVNSLSLPNARPFKPLKFPSPTTRSLAPAATPAAPPLAPSPPPAAPTP